MNDWFVCTTCSEEFKVIADRLAAFCPLCGEELELEEQHDGDEDDY